MQAKMWKEARRVLAVFMAFTMVVMNFSSIPVKADEGTETIAVLNASDLTIGKIEETQTVNGFTLNATAEKFLEVDANSKSIDGFSFTQRLKLGGTGSTSVRNVAYTTTGAATMTVYAISGSGSADRVLALANADGTVAEGNEQTALGASISKLTYSIPAAGTYYLYSKSSGINIYYIAVEEVAGTEPSETESETVSETESETVTETTSETESETTTETEADTSTEGPDDVVTEIEGTKTVYDFRDGSIVPTDTDGKATVTSLDGKLTVECGPSNAYQYNGAQHGVAFKTGNMITIAVPEKAQVWIGGCQYSNSTATVSFSMGGTNLATVNTLTSTCYHQDGAAVAYTYEGEAGNLVLTFADTTYVPVITVIRANSQSGNQGGAETTVKTTTEYNFCDGSIVPTDTDGKATVTSVDGKLTVECGPSNAYQYNGAQHGVAFKTGNTITIKVPEKAVIKIGGCQYTASSATVAFSMGGTTLSTVNTQTTACYHNDNTAAVTYEYEGEAGDLVLTFADTTYVPVITVVRTEPKPEKTEVTANVTIKDEKNLLGDSKIFFVNKADEQDVVDATAGGAVTVKVNATYEIKTNNADISAKNGNFTAFMTETEDVNVVITITSTVIKPVVSISDPVKVLGDAVLTLTNTADATDVVTLVNGEAAKLKIDATYLLACSSASVTATIAGSKLFKAVEGITAIQVDIAETDTSHHTVDVWDFGAEALANTENTTYNNKLTADIINSWFPGVAAGTKGANIAAFEVKDADGNVELAFADGGYTTTHRLRSTNAELTRYDDKSLTDLEDANVVYKGYIYSNKSATKDVHFKVAAKAGDIFTFVVSSNGTTSNIVWTSPSGETDEKVFDAKSSYGQQMTFYAKEDGIYTLHSATEKIVVARIYRERPDVVTVSGNVTAPAGAPINGATLQFTNMTTGAVTKATIADGKYQVSLSEQYAYEMKLEGANGFIIDENNVFSIKNEEGNKTVDVNVIAVDLVKVSGSLADLTAADAKNLKLEFISENVFVPEITINAENVTYEATFEKGVTYEVKESGVEDYTLETTTLKAEEDGTVNIKFAKKPVYGVTVNVDGVSETAAAGVKFTFTRLNEEFEADGYVYTFTGTEGIALRDGQYKVAAELTGYKQGLTADVKVKGAAQTITVKMNDTRVESVVVPYKAEISVGTAGDYKTVNEALEAVRHMVRDNGERVVISIEPGNYEEMLVIDVENVTLKNASSTPSIELTNKGVGIAEGAVRITSYYGHGYTFYSMGADCKYNEELLEINKENGYPSFVNPGSGTTAGSYWNATVSVTASGFEADGIIFENSFNQYVSEKAAKDVIVKQGSAKEGSTARASMEAGDVTVQNKAYVERAAALAIYNNVNDVVFDNCKFVSRQDTLYGGTNTYAEFNECSIYGGTDYIFGGMIAIFNKCDLVFNTSEDKNDVGYITAAQQKSGRGYLMYECHVTSTTPGVDTASAYTSKPGYLGRPWQADTSEVVFYNTTIDAADANWGGGSLIAPAGWLNTLSGESAGMYEYGTIEKAGVDNSASRAAWATVLTEAKLNDGTEINFEAFRRVVEEEKPSAKTEFVLDTTKDLKAFAAGTKADGDSEKAGTDNYFTLLYSTKTKVDSSNKTFDDGYAASQRVNFGDKVSTEKNAIKFTTNNAATVKVWWVEGGDDNRQITILDASGAAVATTNVTLAKNATCISTFDLTEAGTYYLGSTPKNNYIFKVEVTETPGGAVKPPRADWSGVAAPVIKEVALDAEDANTVNVTVNANVGYDGADKVTVVMTDAAGKEIATRNSSAEKEEHVLKFEPDASGTYTFSVKIVREGEEDKAGAETKKIDFVLPLVAPTITGAFNVGGGKVEVEWNAVKEATKYIVYVEGTDISIETTELIAVIEGLEAGKTYTIKVTAVRGSDTTVSEVEKTVENEVEIKWYFSAYGSSTNTSNNGYELLDDGSIRVYSTNGKGKIVPGSTDGLAYYYTLIDPETTNFTLTATAVVNNWTLSNGQEGFGLMAADRVGIHGDGTAFWNNSYQALASKIEYYYDYGTDSATDDSTKPKISMKLGIGSLEKIGVTDENLAEFNANNTAVINEQFLSTTSTLETSCGVKGAGTYNIVGNFTGAEPTGTVANPATEFTFTIQKNNTGYFVSYTDASGKTTTQKYYDTEALNQIVEDSVAIGFFASRNADITFKDISFTTIAPQKDAPAEERPITYISPSYKVTSATVSNSASYEMTFVANADGTLRITDVQDNIIFHSADVKAEEKVTVQTTLTYGNNYYYVTFLPNEDYKPSEYERLSSYEAVSFKHTVNYKAYGNPGDSLYVSPTGRSGGTGAKDNPLDIYTAVKYVQPGQTILLMEGTYELQSTVKVQRGIDGTAENMIYMIADPDAKTRPVFDFGGYCAGMIFAGDYWYFKGFDVTNSADAQKGIQVSGNYNVLDQINAYKNGNTGIQISRYLGTDLYEDWPAYNLILNCTSYENADKGYEDADGFAAKLTVGDGNVFEGCVAHHNADDGWDLFAKVQSGSIGAVTIKNCIAYKNGYVLDANGNEINAGNGNGFKMGGDSMPGAHVLENSIAFFNKAKGIDSNSGPDIKVYNSISFNNGSYNVALYTNTAANTAYEVDGVVSYRTENTSQAEQLKLVGTQDKNKVYGTTNYYWDTAANAAVNSAGDKVTADWFTSLEFTGVTRNEDGTINLNGFLELTDVAAVKAGLSEDAGASEDIEPGKPTTGGVTGTTGGGGSGSGSGTVDSTETSTEATGSGSENKENAGTGTNTGSNAEVEEKEPVAVPEGTDDLVKDLVAEIISGESVGSAVDAETAEKIAEAIKDGKTIVAESVVAVLEASQVPAEEKAAIEALVSSMTDRECGIAQYLDLSVLIGTSEGDTLGNYHETSQKLTFTVEIPSDMLAEGRTFFVVRMHNGDTDVLESKDNGDGTITFKTNKFSTYAIAYIDGEVENLPVVEDNVPTVEQPVVDNVVEREGNDMAILAVIAVLLLAIGSFVIIKRKKASE